jgi:hypothetical protein
VVSLLLSQMAMQQYCPFSKDSQLNDELDLINEGALASRLPGQPPISPDDETEYSCQDLEK